MTKDRLTPERRSALMARIRDKDTAPELLLRRELWRRGFRYRLHRRLHGARPDLIFVGARVVVFIDGCFWHGCPRHYIPPTGNATYWSAKIERNRARDLRNNDALTEAGYTVLRFWECEIKSELFGVVARISRAIAPPR